MRGTKLPLLRKVCKTAAASSGSAEGLGGSFGEWRGIVALFATLAIILGFASCPEAASAQDVISASSGVVQYFEGKIFLDDQLIEHKAAVFPSMKNGSVLRTEKGRVELLLTPGVYLRVDENTTVRMTSNALTDTRIELTKGAIILDNLNGSSVEGVTLTYHGADVRFNKRGVFRLDSDLGELQVYSGEAKAVHQGVSSPVDSSHIYYFDLEFTIDKLGDGATDEFYDWARNRSEVIADKNQSASAEQNPDDPDPSGIPGLLAPYSVPNYGLATPSPLNNYSYNGSAPITPFDYFSYSAGPPYFVYQPLLGFLYLPPIRRPRPVAPTTIGTYHPPIVITRWPRPTGSTFSPLPSLSHYPTVPGYYRAPLSIAHPVGSPIRPASVMPRAPVAAPRPGVVGHR